MSSRVTQAVAAVFAAGTLIAAGAAGAQDSTAPAAHAHAHAKKGAASGATATDDVKAQASYSLGVLIGAQPRQYGLDEKSVDFQKVVQGLKDELSGKAHPSSADGQRVTALIQQNRAIAATKNQAAAHRFLAENGKRQGVTTTASGLQYKVLSPGTGASPQPTDQVTVNYRGTLLDGTEFDSSYRRGKPEVLPVNHVIKGWQEALVMMKPGAKWELYVPPELAYGANSPPPIPPNSLLKFDVELLSVAPQPATPPSLSPQPGAPGGAAPHTGGATGR